MSKPYRTRRVDPERHARPEPVVDDGRHQRTLARHLHLLLDHGGDDEHVVGRELLRARVLHVDLAPGPLERGELVVDELRGGRVLGEVVGGREEESLEVRRVRSLEARREVCRLLRGRQVRLWAQRRRDPALFLRDLVDGRDARRHLLPREPLREDDPQDGLGRRRVQSGGVHLRRAAGPRPEADHGPPDRREQAEAEHDAEQRRQPTTALPAVVVPYAGRLLAFHCR